jgi:drug/metabolite transporter (DMT)-like permease
VLWVPVTVGAASLQVARNALQRGLLGSAGPWGATLVRFLFGLPFSLAFALAAGLLLPHGPLVFGPRFLVACAVAAASQTVATAALLVSMRRSSFALGTVLQQSSIPLAALVGVLLGERLAIGTWLGIACVTAGIAALTWPRRQSPGHVEWTAVVLGLAAGAGFALAANAARQATLALDRADPFVAAQASVFVVQAMQSAALTAWLGWRDPFALKAALGAGVVSLGAGFFGAAASGLWFTAFALSPAGPVRAVGVVELPIAALAGRRLFAERFAPGQWAAATLTAVGVVMASFG